MAYWTHACNTISVKLDETNYPVWVFQMQHYLRGRGLFKFVEGSYLCPTQSLVGDDGSLINNSAARENWLEQDSLVISIIATTLSSDALTLVIGSQTSLEVWTTLKQHYAAKSDFHIMRLMSALHNIRKGTDSIDKYLLRFKTVRDHLYVVGIRILDEDVKYLILAGLPIEYGPTRQIIRGQKSIGMEEVRSLLLTAEFEIELKNRELRFCAQNTMTLPQGIQCNWSPSIASYNFPESTWIANTNAYCAPSMPTVSAHFNAASTPILFPSTGYEFSFGSSAYVNNGMMSNGTCASGHDSMMNNSLASNTSQDGYLSSSYTNTKQLYGSFGMTVPHWNYYSNAYGNSNACEDGKDNSFVSNDSMMTSEEEKEMVVHRVQESVHTEKIDMIESVIQDEKVSASTRINCSGSNIVLGFEAMLDEKLDCNGIKTGNVEVSFIQPQKISKSGPKALSATISTRPKSLSIASQPTYSGSPSNVVKPLPISPTYPLSVPALPHLQQAHKKIEVMSMPNAQLFPSTLDRHPPNCRQAYHSMEQWRSPFLVPPG